MDTSHAVSECFGSGIWHGTDGDFDDPVEMGWLLHGAASHESFGRSSSAMLLLSQSKLLEGAAAKPKCSRQGSRHITTTIVVEIAATFPPP